MPLRAPIAVPLAFPDPDLPLSARPRADATVLTTHAAGGFVGAMVVIHARLEP